MTREIESEKNVEKAKDKILVGLGRVLAKHVSILLYYPVYINTFALAHLLKKGLRVNQVRKKPGDQAVPFEARKFNWIDIVPPDLEKVLSNHQGPDIIYCFSSSDKETVFRQKITEIIQEKNLPYEISRPYSLEATPDNESIDIDVDYSNFSVKYLFFENKINLEQIHEFAKRYFNGHDRTKNPFLTKLVSVLLARGYQTIQIDSDIKDESKSLLRKLLHEEFGFKFRITPNTPEFKANNTLVLETKGGQQSFEETQRQEEGNRYYSNLKTFVVPDKLKYTSKTKLIGIYKKKDDNRVLYNNARTYLKNLVSLIFGKEEQKRLFEEKVHEDFVVENIQYILELIKDANLKHAQDKYDQIKNSHSFFKSLQAYNLSHQNLWNEFKLLMDTDCSEAACRKSRLFKIITEGADYLQINSKVNFIDCLNDHHVNVNNNNPDVNLKDEMLGEFMRFSYEMFSYFKEDERLSKVLLNGLFLLKIILKHPNGIAADKIDKPEKQILYIAEQREEKEKFINQIRYNSYCLLEETIFMQWFNNLRIIAEDINHLIVEEKLLADPRIILRMFDGFDLTEFEYLFSVAYPKMFITQTRSRNQN